MVAARAALLATLALPAVAQERPWPTDGWPRAEPAARGVDGDVLEAIAGEIEDGAWGYVDAMLVIRGGHAVFERAFEHDYAQANEGRRGAGGIYDYFDERWHPFRGDTGLHTMQSVTKSVTSALVGVAIARGELEGVEQPLLGYFPDREVDDADGRKARITLRDVLTMRAGLRWDEWSYGLDDPRNDCIALEACDDWIGFVLAKPMATDPGTTFVYNSGATQLLSGVLARATGKPCDDYAREHLFGPLGIDAFEWKRTPRGLPDTEGGLYLTPSSLAKIGYLYLADGVWDGRRILPEGWVEASTRAWVDDIRPSNDRADPGYGFKWWIERAGEHVIWSARGFGGQFLLVAPQADLIAVFTGWNVYGGGKSIPQLFAQRILPSVD